MDRTPTVVQLRALVAVADHGSLSGAARAMDMTQPALTRQIHLLEDKVGFRLFDRSGRGMQVRMEAQTLVDKARRILEEVEGFGEELGKDVIQGTLKLGIVPTAAAYHFPEIYRGLVRRYPLVKVDVYEMYSMEMVEAVRRGDLDLAFGTLPLPYADVILTRLWSEELVAIFPANEPTSLSAASMEQLAERPFVGFAVGHGLSRRVLELFHESGLQPHVAYEARGIATVIGFVAAGLGISIVPAPLAYIYQDAGLIRAIPLNPAAFRQMVLIHVPGPHLRPSVQSAIQFIESASRRF